jgi:predicted nucleic acid-binding protein
VRYYFLDTSALMKLYALEDGSDRVRDLVRSATAAEPTARILVCDLALPEAVATLARLAAERRVSRAVHARTVERVEADLGPASPFVVVQASGAMALAARVAGAQRLRGADAVHVAAALLVRGAAPDDVEVWFVTADEAQCRGAVGEGLAVFHPAETVYRQPARPRLALRERRSRYGARAAPAAD